ncbi:MAG: hypothetical protein IH831_10470, partial [Planctomycetes bacterium]|nr:hypothetical protein [Planctomycetota bacterium]
MAIRLILYKPLAILLLLALVGCEAVTTNELLGSRSKDNPLNEVAFDGVWVKEEEAFFVKRVNE